MIPDCHMHTPLCGHAHGEPTEYVAAAAAAGIDLITFTCHIPMDDTRFGARGERMRHEDLQNYRDMVDEAERSGERNGVEVLFGIEAEIFPDESIMRAMEQTIDYWNFDFVLGSLHHDLPCYQERIASVGFGDDAEIIRDYFALLSEAVGTGRYDSIAHPDLIRINGTVEPFDLLEYEQEIRGFLAAAAKHDVCLEVNTSGLTKGVYEMHPDPRIMFWAAEAGNRFTLGSDSHKPESVGQYFDRALESLRVAGHDTVHFFRGRRRQAVPI